MRPAGQRWGTARRIVTALVVWAALYLVLSATGFRVEPELFTALVLGVAALMFVLTDLGDVVTRGDWDVVWEGPVRAGPADRRTTRLERWLEDAAGNARMSGMMREALVDVVATALLRDHGVDLRSQPDFARAYLDPVLAAFVLDGQGRTSPAGLADVVTRIERLVGVPGPGLERGAFP